MEKKANLKPPATLEKSLQPRLPLREALRPQMIDPGPPPAAPHNVLPSTIVSPTANALPGTAPAPAVSSPKK